MVEDTILGGNVNSPGKRLQSILQDFIAFSRGMCRNREKNELDENPTKEYLLHPCISGDGSQLFFWMLQGGGPALPDQHAAVGYLVV